MRLILSLIVLTALLTSNPLYAKTLKDKSKVDETSERFMKQILAGEVESAFSLMNAYIGVDMGKFLETSDQAQKGLAQIQKSVGKPLDAALVKTQSIGEHMYKITYLLKYESAALVWELNYYQPEKGWKLVDILYHTNIDKLFE